MLVSGTALYLNHFAVKPSSSGPVWTALHAVTLVEPAQTRPDNKLQHTPCAALCAAVSDWEACADTFYCEEHLYDLNWPDVDLATHK